MQEIKEARRTSWNSRNAAAEGPRDKPTVHGDMKQKQTTHSQVRKSPHDLIYRTRREFSCGRHSMPSLSCWSKTSHLVLFLHVNKATLSEAGEHTVGVEYEF